MLELDMDMEADLGIDSIKRVEILGALQDAHPSLPTFEAEDLAELRSLGEIVDYARSHANGHYDESVSDPREVQNPPTPEHAPSPASASREGAPLPDVETLQRALLDIVSESTGYPAEMLELDMDMEADLGIDSIKRVEILGALQDTYPNLPQVEAEALGELRTLGEIVNFMDNPPQTSAPDDDEDGSKKA
jgi:acyl carrier protein